MYLYALRIAVIAAVVIIVVMFMCIWLCAYICMHTQCVCVCVCLCLSLSLRSSQMAVIMNLPLESSSPLFIVVLWFAVLVIIASRGE